MDEELFTQVCTVGEIYETLSGLIGQPVRVKANMGRSKIIEREGTLIQAHRSLFLIETKEKRGRKARQSYQYVDVLTGTVELTNLETGENMFPQLQEVVA